MRPILIMSPMEALRGLMLETEAVFKSASRSLTGKARDRIHLDWDAYIERLVELRREQSINNQSPSLENILDCVKEARKLERTCRRFIAKYGNG